MKARSGLEAFRLLLHKEGSWEVMATTVPGAGRTEGGDAVIDDFLAPEYMGTACIESVLS